MLGEHDKTLYFKPLPSALIWASAECPRHSANKVSPVVHDLTFVPNLT